MTFQYVVHTIKGFGDIAKAEILLKIPEAFIISSKAKAIVFEATTMPGQLPALRTVDDVGLLVVLDQPVSDLQSPTFMTKDIIGKIQSARDLLSKTRKLSTTFSVTISRYKSAVNTEALTTSLSKQLSEALHMDFTPRSHENFDIRLDLELETYSLSIRVGTKPSFHRAYKISSQPGALKPSVGASIVCAALGTATGLKIVDNLCGSGTILCEAALMNNIPYGGDISDSSVNIARKNLSSIYRNLDATIKQLDATSSPWKTAEFDGALSNVPWDIQIPTTSIMTLYDRVIKEYGRIVKPNGTIAILSKKPDFITKLLKKYVSPISLREYPLSFLGQNPTLVVANSRLPL